MTVSGTGLDLVDEPQMYIELVNPVSARRRRRRFSRAVSDNRKLSSCMNATSTEMVCVMPEVPESWLQGSIQYGFIMNNVEVN